MQQNTHNIIIAGAGLSGLSLALELSRRPAFRQQRILVLDRVEKRQNDRTWCFWAGAEEPLPPVVHKSWDLCRFYGAGLALDMAIAPYRYHMVRGADFYRWADEELAQNPNIQRLKAKIVAIDAETGVVHTDAGDFKGDYVFNSAFTPVPLLAGSEPLFAPPFSVAGQSAETQSDYVFLLQHFKGWLIQTPAPAFEPDKMTFMDFRIDQCGETRFVYVLPLSETRALVEFTVFSPALLPAAAYDSALKEYLARWLQLSEYTIEEEEFGVIPMSDFPFPRQADGRVIHIGTAGGMVKASSGFAFQRVQRKLRRLVDGWERRGYPDSSDLCSTKLFRVFDSIFLKVLAKRNALGSRIFSSLFAKLPPALVLRFLDEDTTFTENIRLVQAPPTWPFLQALFQRISVLHKL